MKLLISLLIATYIFTLKLPQLPVCNYQSANQAIPVRIFFEQTIDGKDQPILLTRFLHNKIGIYGSEFGKCYFNFFDPVLIYHTIGLLGLFFWLFLLYQIVTNGKWNYLPIVLILPILPLLNIFPSGIAYFHKIFAIIGLILFTFKKK